MTVDFQGEGKYDSQWDAWDEINVMIPKGIPGGRSRVWRIANAALEAGSEDRS